MKRLGHYTIEEIDRIVDACAVNGWAISREEALKLWERVSENACAQALMVPEDPAEIFELVEEHLREGL